jgi:uncharacterized MAPEG superfamily protein
MTTPFWCLLIAIFLPYVFSGATAFFKQKQFGTLDNRHPRAQAAALEGPGARAYAAQANAWEALAVFVPSVLVAHLAGADPAASATRYARWPSSAPRSAVCGCSGWPPQPERERPQAISTSASSGRAR